jgi:hypothetical protein
MTGGSGEMVARPRSLPYCSELARFQGGVYRRAFRE